jgi:uroporphyrinogen-III synthase
VSRTPHLLVTRPEAESRQTANALEALGFRVTQAPCLQIVPILSAPLATSPDAVLLTSQHAVPALHALHVPFATPLFVAGKRTAEKAREAGYIVVHTGEGNALSLRPLLHQTLPASANIAYLHGEDLRHNMASLLQAEGYNMESHCVYRAEPATSLPSQALAALHYGQMDGILFYSVRTLETFATLASTCLPAAAWQSVSAIAISGTVAHAARTAGFDIIHVVPLQEGPTAFAALKTLFS